MLCRNQKLNIRKNFLLLYDEIQLPPFSYQSEIIFMEFKFKLRYVIWKHLLTWVGFSLIHTYKTCLVHSHVPNTFYNTIIIVTSFYTPRAVGCGVPVRHLGSSAPPPTRFQHQKGKKYENIVITLQTIFKHLKCRRFRKELLSWPNIKLRLMAEVTLSNCIQDITILCYILTLV
jgi:hypothetical protein